MLNYPYPITVHVAAMIFEKRFKKPPVPGNLEALLTDGQVKSLRRVENFGWTLKFVRQPHFEPPTVVVENASGLRLGLLEENGDLKFDPILNMRS